MPVILLMKSKTFGYILRTPFYVIIYRSYKLLDGKIYGPVFGPPCVVTQQLSWCTLRHFVACQAAACIASCAWRP